MRQVIKEYLLGSRWRVIEVDAPIEGFAEIFTSVISEELKADSAVRGWGDGSRFIFYMTGWDYLCKSRLSIEINHVGQHPFVKFRIGPDMGCAVGWIAISIFILFVFGYIAVLVRSVSDKVEIVAVMLGCYGVMILSLLAMRLTQINEERKLFLFIEKILKRLGGVA